MFWPGLALSYFGGCALSWLVEAFLAPRPQAPWRRPVAALGIHAGTWTLAYALALALFQRPYFAVANVLALEIVLVVVNNAKHRVLNEPFVYPDFDYFWDAVRHPRLYLPFLSPAPVVIGIASYGAALWLGFTLEPSIVAAAGPFYLAVAALAAAGLALACAAARRKPQLTFDAAGDLRRLGLLAALWWYGRSEREPVDHLAAAAPFGAGPRRMLPTAARRDLVCIQSESFFDARRAYPALVRQSVLANFDALRAQAVAQGRLQVAVWGANTVRTEFAFLSGLAEGQLGVHRYNPYRRLAGHGIATLASWLRSQGYRTVCVHPYHGSFYQRDRVLPRLGFDEFIDISAFGDAPCCGPYVGDQAVADYVRQLLDAHADGPPLYVHVITMENHGPLHLEDVSDEDAARVLQAPMPPGCEDLVAYARHLVNADRSFAALADCLRARARPGVLCIYGDHVPIMADVYRRLGAPDGATDYLVWQSDAPGHGQAVDVRVEELALQLAQRL